MCYFVPYNKCVDYEVRDGRTTAQTKPDAYFKKSKSNREARLHYIVQFYQHEMKHRSLTASEGLRYVRVLQTWQKEFGSQLAGFSNIIVKL